MALSVNPERSTATNGPAGRLPASPRSNPGSNICNTRPSPRNACAFFHWAMLASLIARHVVTTCNPIPLVADDGLGRVIK
jgi:hypothetical protein